MTPPSPKKQVFEHLARVGKGLAHAARLDLLEALAQGERSVDALATTCGMPISNASHQTAGSLAEAAQAQLGCAASGIAGANVRRNTAYQARLSAAQAQRAAFECSNFPNCDEDSLPANISSYSKGLAHNDLGEVSPSAYQTLVFALNTNSRSALATVAMGTTPPTRLGAVPGVPLPTGRPRTHRAWPIQRRRTSAAPKRPRRWSSCTGWH